MTRRQDDPAVAAFVEAFTRRLEEAIGERTYREIAVLTGLAHSTVARLAEGRVVPDLTTLWRLEVALDADLWPADENRRLREEFGRDAGRGG